MGKKITLCFLFFILLPVAASRAGTAWQSQGLPLATGAGNQDLPVIISDGTGGTVVIWQDDGPGYEKLYAQRLDRYGAKLWNPSGNAVSSRAADQRYPTGVPDGSGGCLVFWTDDFGANRQIYGQHISSQGALLWTSQGQAVDPRTHDQDKAVAVSDGSGGAVVVWRDWRNVSGGNDDVDLYAQRVSVGGAALYAGGSTLVSLSTQKESDPFTVGDHAGGVFIAWGTDQPNLDDNNVYAQQLNDQGTRQWGYYGVTLCEFAGYQSQPTAVLGPSGGLWAAWEDHRPSARGIYMQLLDSYGNPQWATGGTIVSGTSQYPLSPTMTTDGAGGAFVLFGAERNSVYGLYVRHVRNTVFMLLDDHVTIYGGGGFNWDGPLPIVSDGNGGCYVVWPDGRTGTERLYGQHVNSGDRVSWKQGGIPLVGYSSYQSYPYLSEDTLHGAVCGWRDSRGLGLDVYAQRLTATPPLSALYFLLFGP